MVVACDSVQHPEEVQASGRVAILTATEVGRGPILSARTAPSDRERGRVVETRWQASPSRTSPAASQVRVETTATHRQASGRTNRDPQQPFRERAILL